MDTKPSKGHVWTPAKNDVFRYEEIVAPNTWALDTQNFQF
jgi:hypothetical protein